ncbi:MAG: response regulator [Methylococcaceae bacterium]|nr:response regulator [Methylococcaceae bacterium]
MPKPDLSESNETKRLDLPHSPAGHVYLIEDHDDLRIGLVKMLQNYGFVVYSFSRAIEFLDASLNDSPAVIITDMRMPEMSGVELQATLLGQGRKTPILFISGESTVEQSVKAMKQGAFEFLIKPFSQNALLEAVRRGIEKDLVNKASAYAVASLDNRLNALSPREREVFWLLTKGYNNKQLVNELGVSLATAKQYKAQVIQKMGVRSISEMVEFTQLTPVRS